MTREDIKIEFEKFLKFKYRIYRDIEGKEKLTVYEIDSDSLEDFATHVHNLIIKGKIEEIKKALCHIVKPKWLIRS